jgi:protein-S-isoprenylcysteine O-methyltransferase Ste14
MRSWESLGDRLPPRLLAWIWSALLLLQVILAFFVFREPKIQALSVAGWVLWTLGTVFAILPIWALRTKGHVPEGKSYMATTALVDTEIYAIVRHPQGGTAGLLLNLALVLLGQQWLLVILAVVGMALIYMDTFGADEACIAKFGEEYERYMKRVPRVNFVAGLLRLLVRPRASDADPPLNLAD